MSLRVSGRSRSSRDAAGCAGLRRRTCGASGDEGEEGEDEMGAAAVRDFADSLRGLLDVRDRMRRPA